MTEIRRLFQQGKEFVPISLAEAVVVNTNNLPGFNSLKITTLDRVLYRLTGVVGTNTINIKNVQDTKQDKLTTNCPKPELHTHLCKENYLGEFKEESEKALARDNLGVYSKDEVSKVLADAVANLDSSIFITKKEVYNLVENLDFVNSSIKANIDYEIPEQLFSL